MATIKIPDSYYCGRYGVDQLGFITPDGTDAAAKKRKDTINSWTQRSGSNKCSLDDPNHFFSFKNTPTSGFTLQYTVVRHRTNNKLFQVRDPRGFEIQISAENLADICVEGGVNNGHFIGSYVYGREGRDNVLLPIGSPIFKEAFELTKTVKQGKLSLRELKIGQKVKMLYQNESIECLYVGRQWHAHTETQYHYDRNNNRWPYKTKSWNTWKDILAKPKHMFINLSGSTRAWHTLLAPSNPHVVRILEQNHKTEAQAIKELAKCTGKVLNPFEPPNYAKTRAYKTRPDFLNLYTLDKAAAEKAIADRADYLKNFVSQEIPPK